MRTSISYTFAYPNRIPTRVEKLKLSEIKKLTFYEPDFKGFHVLI